jgi:mannose-6-phosphate isomerase-like protein (cupin superfamily)
MSPLTAVSELMARNASSPDETRTPALTRSEVVTVGGYTLSRMTLEPGWRWSECIKPVAGTDSCQLSHVGYLISGRMSVSTPNATQEIGPGDFYSIPPGHDAFVVGDQPVVGIELVSAAEFAKPAS